MRMLRSYTLLFLAIGSAFAQNTAVFPTAVSTNKDLLTASNRASTTLNGAINSSTLTIVVVNAAAFTVPAGGGLAITIGDERILVCSKASNTFTVCASGRGYDGSTPAAHADAVLVTANSIAWHHNQLAAEVKALETTWGTDLPRYCRSTTGNDTYTCPPAPPLPAYKRGTCLVLDADTANTLTATVNVSGLGSRSILNRAGSALATGDVTANKPITVCDDGTQFIVQGDGGGAGAGDAFVANPLSQFAATTSAQFTGVISDEVGIGSVVAATPAFATLTDGATITWALASAVLANATVTLGGNRTLNITGPVNGGSYVLRVVQDGTGSRGLTLGTGCTWKVANGGGGAIFPSTAASTIDILAFITDGTNCYASLSKNHN